MPTLTDSMRALYAEMQAAYSQVAEHYAFSCMGCTDNCCTQRFHHHTQAEYHYLLEGLRQAAPALVRGIIERARAMVAAYEHEAPGRPAPLMCPVNVDGLCALYEHRPMICRLHGVPHRFIRPDGREERGGGCIPFSSAHAKADWTLNRTPHYRALARIEAELRARSRVMGRYSATTAEMLVEMALTDDEIKKALG